MFPAFSAVYSSLNGSDAAEDFRCRWGLVSGDFSGHCHVYCNFSNACRPYLGNAAPHGVAAVCQWLTNVAGMQLRSVWHRILQWRWTRDVAVAAYNHRIPNTLSLLTSRLNIRRFAFKMLVFFSSLLKLQAYKLYKCLILKYLESVQIPCGLISLQCFVEASLPYY